MALNPLKVFVFVVGGTVAAAATAFYSGAMKTQSRLAPGIAANESAGGTSVAVLTQPASTGPQTAGGKGDKPSGGPFAAEPKADQSSAGETQPSASSQLATAGNGSTVVASLPEPSEPDAPAAPATAPSATMPAENSAATAQPEAEASNDGIPDFDLVRVEPDGSMVVAGHAAPQAKVDLVGNGKVLSSTTSSDEGDFAIVLDEPLKPGEHQLQLSGTTADGSTETSAQTAIISVPEKPDGQVLAMVEEPGSPSRVLTAPQAPASEKPAASRADEAASADAAKPAAPAQGTAAETQASASEPSLSPARQDPPAPRPASTEQVQASIEPASAPSSGSQQQSAGEQEAALSNASPNAAAGAPKAPAASQSAVSVQAVEIEGRKIYVAGRAASGSTVRVYANDVLLGDAKASSGGQFLIETTRDLAVGTYTVRADMLNARGAVTARAEVPFEREAGEAVAAVAPELQAEADAGSVPSQGQAPTASRPVQANAESAGSGMAAPTGSRATTSASGGTASPAANAASAAQANAETPSSPPGDQALTPSQPARPNAEDADGEPAGTSAGGRLTTVASDEAAKPAESAEKAVPAEADATALPLQEQASAAPQPGQNTVEGADAALAQPPTSGRSTTAAPETDMNPAANAAAEVQAEAPRAPSTSEANSGVLAFAEPQAVREPEGPNGSSLADAGIQEVETERGAAPSQSDTGISAAGGAGSTPATAVTPAQAPDTAGDTPAAAAGIVASAGDEASAAARGAVAAAAGEPVTEIAPKLQNVDAAIIIRRGDSLWRISRRVYGFGTRYSTLYLANSDQIRNPDLIMPGQVFAVPARSQQGETADLGAIEEQMTTTLPATAAEPTVKSQ